MASRLSLYMVGIVSRLTCSSEKSDDSQRTSTNADFRALYSNLLYDIAITLCLKDFQEKRLQLYNVTCSEVDV